MKYIVSDLTGKLGENMRIFVELMRIGAISFPFAHHFLEFPDLIPDSRWTPNFLISWHREFGFALTALHLLGTCSIVAFICRYSFVHRYKSTEVSAHTAQSYCISHITVEEAIGLGSKEWGARSMVKWKVYRFLWEFRASLAMAIAPELGFQTSSPESSPGSCCDDNLNNNEDAE